MAEILCIGEPLYELNQRADGLFTPGFGGDVSNVAIAAARQGASTGLISRIGADAFGDRFLALWAKEGVDATHVARDPDAPTGLYLITHDADGHHFAYRRAGSAASRMTPNDLPEDALRAAKIVHASGISLGIGAGPADSVLRAFEIARSAGVRVSFDTNMRLALWPLARARALINAAAALSDIVLPGLDDARQLTGLQTADEIVDFYLGLGAGTVALTLGKEGALVATPDSRRLIPGLEVQAIDATGAGDCFDGAFLAELSRGASPFDAARYANTAAALSTTGYGAVGPIPRRLEVTPKFIDRDGE